MGIQKKTIEVNLDEENRLNISIFKDGGKFVKFAINYSTKIKEVWVAIYRVDNYHGFIHEQRLWKTKEPIPLPEFESWELKEVFDHFYEKVSENCLRFRHYYVMKNG